MTDALRAVAGGEPDVLLFRVAPEPRVTRAEPALALDYVLAAGDLDALGRAIARVQASPVLVVAGQPDPVRVMLVDLPLADQAAVWAMLAAPYRPSVVCRAAPVVVSDPGAGRSPAA